MDRLTWLVLAHQVPVKPSKKRVYVWRKLKEMGSTYFRQGVAMLPKTPDSMANFQNLAEKIDEMGGEATIAELRFIDKKDEMKAISEFKEQSREEYEKIIKEITVLNQKIADDKPPSPQLSTQINRLQRRLTQIQSRDYFLLRKEPEVSEFFDELLKDMSQVSYNLSKHFKKIWNDR